VKLSLEAESGETATLDTFTEGSRVITNDFTLIMDRETTSMMLVN
jgi:hypothetical protein